MKKYIKDEDRFLQIVDQNLGIIIKISNYYAYTLQDREDLRNDIVFELWKSYNTFEGRSGVSTWLYRVALNTSMNFNRKQKKNGVIKLGIQSSDIGSENWVVQPDEESRSELLHKAIDELTDLNKAIMLLYLDGKTHEEISLITGIVGLGIIKLKG